MKVTTIRISQKDFHQKKYELQAYDGNGERILESASNEKEIILTLAAALAKSAVEETPAE